MGKCDRPPHYTGDVNPAHYLLDFLNLLELSSHA